MKRILVANRGEIAIRIMRTAKKMGIATIAVYSDADRDAPHVRFADEAWHLGPSPANESYLRVDKILEIAKASKADAIHPGYGFLSEQAVFAQAISDAGMIFIGPSPHAINVMGNKLAAKNTVIPYNIPMVPGSPAAIKDALEAEPIAKQIGYPILLKASAGGGGKGMRIVYKSEDLASQLARASSEALSSFGDGSVFIEKYIQSPHHIEVQVMADHYGNTLYLFERECSIQRRHQKVVEEAPSPFIDESVRKAIGEAAVRVAIACSYTNAGTVEFLMDEDKNFYFLEMNTRLQVEHPVTEHITGLDLVEWQIRIARGEPLPFRQDELKIQGHAIELRVYAEDPENQFLPGTGTLDRYQEPAGIGIRVDSGFEEGMEVPIYYDPMLSKLITYGKNRAEAIQKMKEAILNYDIEGLPNNLAFGYFIMQHPLFEQGNYDTHFIEDHFRPDMITAQREPTAKAAGAIAAWLHHEYGSRLRKPVNQIQDWYNNRRL
ncbi:MAG: acetyl-CoA carboxylase biotin carboxylase subunit [Saprospiraceae bacterium]|nr:acetyl-CoA carboxylase biotin carboxylase subunit [Saprospiraceae bacterium]